MQLTTVDELIDRVPVRATDPPAAQAVKHDARMAQMLARALWRRLTKPTEPTAPGGDEQPPSAPATPRPTARARGGLRSSLRNDPDLGVAQARRTSTPSAGG